jgi:hypothetical protein
MLGLNLSGLFIYHITGGFNVFHALAILNLALLVVGVAQVLRRPRWRNWRWRHYQYMCWSYVALLAGASNEAFVRLSPLRQLKSDTTTWLPLIVALAIVAVSGLIIVRRQPDRLGEFAARRDGGGEAD